jgi:isoleucyl-tRNA synthetase
VDTVAVDRMPEIDRWALAKFAECAEKIVKAYEDYDYPAIFQAANTFITVDLSAFYVDVSKDRLYTLAAGSPSRRAAQTAMYTIVDGLTRLMAPVLPITAEQLWKVLPGTREPSVHLADFPRAADLERTLAPRLFADWERLLALRDAVNAEIERQRKAKVVGNSLGASVRILAADADHELLDRYRGDLPMLFIVSDVQLERSSAGDSTAIRASRAAGVKCSRCWRVVPSVSDESGREGLCDRCIEALAEPVRL